MLFLALSRLVCVLALACVIAALFLPWFSGLSLVDQSFGRVTSVVIIKTESQTAAPSLCLFVSPVMISLIGSILLWPCSSHVKLGNAAWVGGLFSLAAGSAGAALMFVYTGKVATWSLTEGVKLGSRGPGWWLCLASSLSVAVSGALAVFATAIQRKRKTRIPGLKGRKCKLIDVETVEIKSPIKKTFRMSPAVSDKTPASASYSFDVTPMYDRKRRDWFAASSNPLFTDLDFQPERSGTAGAEYFIRAARPTPRLDSPENLQVGSEQQWLSGGESLREKYGQRSRRESPCMSEDGS